jgi:hypothetical protein
MNNEWYQTNSMPYLYEQENGQVEMMREPKHGHGGGHHGPHGNPGYHGGYGKPSHGPQGGFQGGGGLPFLGGLAGGLLAGSLINSPGPYPYPYNPNPYYGYYPGYPQVGYPPYPYGYY